MKKTGVILNIYILSILTSCNLTKTPLTYDEGVVINGVKWATRNVDKAGTFAPTPESAGKFYQWNRKKAWNTIDKTVKNWNKSIPKGTEWTKNNDPSPAGWRIPTKEEIQLLFDANNVSNEWVTTPANGRLFTDLNSGNTLFFPACGWRDNYGTISCQESGGYYWSNTQYDEEGAYYIIFYCGGFWGFTYEGNCYISYSYRENGISVRCVAEQNPIYDE